jgi:rSAM/selenodomain-associated transferase 2
VTVSVIIPALDEEEEIGETLASVRRQPGPFEVVVVDGGSADRTLEIAREAAGGFGRLAVLSGERGRARQMNIGAARSSGEVLLFLHADTRLPEGALDHIRGALASTDVVGGCFRLAFSPVTPLLRFYTLPIWMRAPSLVFGDRGIFVRREVFDAVGGFPDRVLMEDADFVKAIRRVGRFMLLAPAVVTSSRRFTRHGTLRQQLRNGALLALHLLGVDPARLKRFYSDAR